MCAANMHVRTNSASLPPPDHDVTTSTLLQLPPERAPFVLRAVSALIIENASRDLHRVLRFLERSTAKSTELDDVAGEVVVERRNGESGEDRLERRGPRRCTVVDGSS